MPPNNSSTAGIEAALLAIAQATLQQTQRNFAMGSISAATFSTTGIKPITGLGFLPRFVFFIIMPIASTTNMSSGLGAMTPTNQFWTYTSSTTTAFARDSGMTACIVVKSSGTNTSIQVASYASMDSDGFSINVTTAGATFDVTYIAIA